MKDKRRHFTIILHTTDENITPKDISNFMGDAICSSNYEGKLFYILEEGEKILYNFLNSDKLALMQFITHTKKDFLEIYPYFAEEYYFCNYEFYINRVEVLLNLLEETSTIEETEPYKLTPADFQEAVETYIKLNMTKEEQKNFIKLAKERGFKISTRKEKKK